MTKRLFTGQFLHQVASDERDDVTIIEEGEWEQDYKMQNREILFKFEGKVYSITEVRSGSPWTDWHYEDFDDEELEEHTQVEIVVHRWVPLSQKIKSQINGGEFK